MFGWSSTRPRCAGLFAWAVMLLGVLLGNPAYSGTVLVSWTAPIQDTTGSPLTGATSLTGYRLYERCGADPYAQIPLPVSQLQVTRTTPDGTTCYWQISAVNSQGESARSSEGSKVFPATQALPGAPSDLRLQWSRGPPMSSFSDDFNRADGGLGANYFVPVGSAGVVSNTAQSLATSIAIVVVTAAGNVADGSIEVTYGANDSSQFSQLSARNDGAGNFVYVETFGGTTYLYESVSGVPALLDSVASAPGPGDTLKLNFNGTALSVDLNGSPILSGTTSITSANLLVFILSPSGASGDVSIDDLVIVDAGGGITADAADTNTPTDSAVSVTQRLSVGTDTNSPTDSAVSITSRLSVGVDTNTPTDSAVSISQRLSVAADTNTPTDSAVSGVVSTCVAADTNTPTDSAEAAVGFPAEAADTNTPTDSAVSITARLSVAEDTNTPTDSAEGGVVNTCVAADTNTPTDSAEAGAQLPSVASDTNIPTDSAVASNVPAGVSAGVDTNTPTDSAVSITTRTAMAEDFNTPSDSAICISSGGGSVYKYIDGTAFDRYGRMMTVPLGISDPLPATARYIMGIAHSQNGRRYVTRWPGSIIKHIDGYALRDDGVQVVAPDADIDGALAGIPVTYRRETVVSDNYPSKAVGGWGLDAAGRLTVTNHGA